MTDGRSAYYTCMCVYTLYKPVLLSHYYYYYCIIVSVLICSSEMIITARGDNIAPVPIESLIKEDMPIISNVVLIGDQRDYLVCLITLKVSSVA